MSCTPPPQSCHDKLIELFSEKLYLIGLAALVVAVIMVSQTERECYRPACFAATPPVVDEEVVH